MHEIITTQTGVPENTSRLNGQVQNADTIYNFESIGTLNLQQFIIASSDLIPLEHLRFDTSKYNLFVVDEEIKTTGTFSLPDCAFPKDMHLTRTAMKQLLMYPSLITKKNDSFRQTSESHNAYIAKVYHYEHHGNSLKFWYIASIKLKQELINIHPGIFDIKDSGQTNELDKCCVKIKKVNIIKALGLEVADE